MKLGHTAQSRVKGPMEIGTIYGRGAIYQLHCAHITAQNCFTAYFLSKFPNLQKQVWKNLQVMKYKKNYKIETEK